MQLRRGAFAVGVALAVLCCKGKQEPEAVPSPPKSSAAASSSKPVATLADAAVDAALEAPCPEGMAYIDGRFCIDRWEAATESPEGELHSPFHAFGNEKVRAVSRANVIPQAYVSAGEAEQACRRAGKTLCSTQQWQDACMGVRRPYRIYPYGMTEDASACNTTRALHPSVEIFGKLKNDSVSLNHPKLDQLPDTLEPTGKFSRCVTPEGVYDLQGNLLEWTQGDQKALLMGGHFVEAKQHGAGCRYVTAGHGPDYHDYTTGFRCCQKPSAPVVTAESRDPPGMRGFTDAVGKMPELEPPPYEPPDAKCPADMVYVEGLRCAEPIEFCKRWLERKSAGEKIACAEFAAPTECHSARRSMRYCIDRYELTPPGYTYPITHVNWGEARNLCRAMDKRLCREAEWEFACEGPDALPYPYGFVRDAKKCNHDFPEEELAIGPDELVDRRVKKDALPGCKSPFGVYNLVGNVDEWTERDGAEPSKRAILRGGWWLIGRNRCRAATSNHGERYAGQQTGVRCCKAAR